MVNLRKLLLDNHLMEDPRFYRHLDVEKIVETWAKSHINMAMIDFNDIWGNSYYNTKIGHKFAQLGERDQMAEMIKELRKRDIEVGASYITLWQYREKFAHPEWIQKYPGGKLPPGRLAGFVCPNSPFREFVLAQLKEITMNYDIDYFFLDMPCFAPGLGASGGVTCYCEYCKRKFKDRFGFDIPTEQDWTDPKWRTFVKWRYDVMYNFVKDCVDAIKSIKKIPVSIQWINSFQFNFEWGIPEGLAEIPDLIAHDPNEVRDGMIVYSLLPRLYRAQKDGPPYSYEVFATRHLTGLGDLTFAPIPHLAARIYSILINGARPIVIDQIHPDGFIQQTPYNRIGEVYGEVEKREEWLQDIEPSPLHKYTAVYYSQTSRDFYGRESPDRYLLSFTGASRALLESHIPFDIVVDRQINQKRLSEYKVLILANVACLTETQEDEIRKYVENGGGLVATYKTSLTDELGDPKEDFGLSDVLNVRYVEPSNYSHNYLQKVMEHPILKDLPEDPVQLSNLGYESSTEEPTATLKTTASSGAESIANIVFPYIEPTEDKWVSHCNPPSTEVSSFPAIVCSRYGKGKVVYFAYRPCALYGQFSYPEHRALIVEAVKWAAGERPPLEVEAPRCVEATIWEQPDKRRFVIHLLNYAMETGRNIKTPTQAGQIESIHVIQEVIPIADVKVRAKIPERSKIRRIYKAPDLKPLKYAIKEGCVEISIPKIGLWTTITVQL